MGDNWPAWLIGLPLAGASAASLFLYAAPRSSRQLPVPGRLELAGLSSVLSGILLSMWVLLAAGFEAQLGGALFRLSDPTRIVLFAADIALLCSLFTGWTRTLPGGRYPAIWGPGVAAALLAAAATVRDGLTAILCLFGAALVVAAWAGVISPARVEDDPGEEDRYSEAASRMVAALKHIALATIGTGLLAMGLLLLGRYGLGLENRALLQLSVGLLSVGLLVRGGVVPFAGATSDLLSATPGAATLALGGVLPVLMLVGLAILSPVDAGLLGGSSTAWLGALAVLLGGVRALGVRNWRFGVQGHTGNSMAPPDLVSATLAVQVGWALTGLLAGSQSGAVGALLLAVNLAIAAPLAVASATGLGTARLLANGGLLVAVASLLGLPPFGGFFGTLLVAQAAANLGGPVLALLLLGNLLVAARWVSFTRAMRTEQPQGSGRIFDASSMLIVVLLMAQVALLAISPLIQGTIGLAGLAGLAGSPWLSSP